jgi:hypothetical protein
MKNGNKYIIILAILCCISPTSIAQLVIGPGSSITIKDGTSLYIGTNLFVESDSTGSGHFADQNTGGNTTITGDATIQRYLTEDGWHNVSSPITNANSSLFSATDLVFYYDETIILNDWNFGWIWHEGNLSVMRGYDVFSPTILTINYYAPIGSSIHTGNYSIGVTRTDVGNGETENRKGWNLIGNPYPSPINWLEESGWDKSNINDAKYIWCPNNNNYTIYLGGTNPVGINGATQYIPSNQGFWVQAVTNGSVSINNSSRLGIAIATPDYYKNSNINQQEILLISHGNGYTDETMIRFISGSTPGFDINQDASKLLSTHDSVPQLFTKSNNARFAINTYPEINTVGEIDLHFQCNTNGYYSISIDSKSTIDYSQSIYLKDNDNQTMYNLSNLTKYTFFHNRLNNNSRFKIFINPSEEILNNILPENYFSVSTNKNAISIIKNTSKTLTGQIKVYNINGQLIKTETLSNNHINRLDLNAPNGYYILNIKTNENVINYKIRVSH